MPIYNRQGLRQSLGQNYLRDTLVSKTTWATASGSAVIADFDQVDLTASGEQLYYRHWLQLLGSTGKFQAAVRVASFVVASGYFQWVSPIVGTALNSGAPYEVHALLSPVEKDNMIDLAIKDIRCRQEVAVWAIDQGHVYSLGQDIKDVIDVRYLSDPTDSLNIGEHPVQWWKWERTGSGQQLRINPALLASQQLVIDAMLAVSLGANDLATVNLPSDEWVLAGAAARCYGLLRKRAPGQEGGTYREDQAEYAGLFTRLSARFQPPVSRKIQLDEPY